MTRILTILLLLTPLTAHAFADSGIGAAMGDFVVSAMHGTSSSPDNTSHDDDDDE
jgi:hypothetical protein